MKFSIKRIFIFLSICVFLLLVINRYLPSSLFKNKYENESLIIYYNGEKKDSALKIITSKVSEGLKKSPFEQPKRSKIYLCNSHSLFMFFGLIDYKASAFTRNDTKHTFLSKCEIDKNLTIADRLPLNQRNISSTIVHEIMHTEIRTHYGYLKTISSIDTWKEEGYCDYIAHESSYGFANGIKDFMSGIKKIDGSYQYFLYRLYITYLIDYKKQSFDTIVKTKYEVEKLQSEILTNLLNKSFAPKG